MARRERHKGYNGYQIRETKAPWNDFCYMALLDWMIQTFNAFGFTPAARYDFISATVGRPIQRMDDLTYVEWEQVKGDLLMHELRQRKAA